MHFSKGRCVEVYKTIEAIYDNGQIISVEEPINIKRGKVLITILEEEPDEIRGVSAEELSKYQGILKSFKEDPVEYQRRLRDEW